MLRSLQPPQWQVLTENFPRLDSLQMEFCARIIDVLPCVGLRLRELSLVALGNHTWGVNALQILRNCPCLEFLSLQGIVRKVNTSGPFFPEHMPLKKLFLRRVEMTGNNFLPLLLQAPLLEHVSLSDVFFCDTVTRKLTQKLLVHFIFQNLTSFEMRFTKSLPTVRNAWIRNLEYFAKNVAIRSPKLQSVVFDLSGVAPERKFMLVPFTKLVNNL